jgi:hypothetical protein
VMERQRKVQIGKLVSGSMLLIFGCGFASYVLLNLWSLHTVNSNPFTPLFMSILEIAAISFSGGAVTVGGAWLVSSAINSDSQS